MLPNSGAKPSRRKVKPMRAASEAKRMSHASGIVAPTPTATPLIAAITGLGMLQSVSSRPPGPHSAR